jgi:transposase, IS30 family
MGLCYEHLSYVDRLSIDECRWAGLSLRAIARKLKRAPSTASRDVQRMGPYRLGYAAPRAFFGALYRRSQSSQGTRKLIPDSALFSHVTSQLREGWSPGASHPAS